MSAPIIHHREATRTARSRQHPSVVQAEWLGPRSPMFRVVRPKPATRMDRLAAACWRVHDAAIWLWFAAGVVVLAASLLSVAGIAHFCWGWL